MSVVLKILSKARTAYHLPLKEKIWLLLLYPYSGLIRAAILFLPFKWISGCLGRHYQNHQLSPLVSESQRLLAWRIGRIAEITARYTPWESKCLVQAIMARTLLGYYHIPYALHLGAKMAANNTNDPMQAHAWVKVGNWIITGREGHRSYAVVASYLAPSILEY